MSHYLYITRYANRERDPENFDQEPLPISCEMVEAAASALSWLKFEMYGEKAGVKLLSYATAVLEDGGAMIVHTDTRPGVVDSDLLIATLKEFAEQIPDGIVEDEEGNVL
jgi:hypothetical protein